ncbi:hypothetical protein Syun_011944 [Stephania yunnanensis]|uniref:Uncharacterized protein n=1 Tax=Stephania yunnanensis TaxID=152371 RepID=A0AAP0JZ94_9MAGN
MSTAQAALDDSRRGSSGCSLVMAVAAWMKATLRPAQRVRCAIGAAIGAVAMRRAQWRSGLAACATTHAAACDERKAEGVGVGILSKISAPAAIKRGSNGAWLGSSVARCGSAVNKAAAGIAAMFRHMAAMRQW